MADRVVATSGPDGGWGWVIVFAVFMGNVLIEGTAVALFGLLYPELLVAFQSTPALTSLAGSMIVGVYLFISHFVGSLVQRFGCKTVCFAGGCVGATGLLLSMTSQSIVTFILTFGIIGGFGLGLNSLPGNVMVNLYFNRRRGIAQGIVTSGAGCGVLIMAPLTQVLLEAYGWRGTMLVMAGLNLQFCVLACLMRPVSDNKSPDSNSASEASQDVMLEDNGNKLSYSVGDFSFDKDQESGVVQCKAKVTETEKVCKKPDGSSAPVKSSCKDMKLKMFGSVQKCEQKQPQRTCSLDHVTSVETYKSSRLKSNIELNKNDDSFTNNHTANLKSLPNLHLRFANGNSEYLFKQNHCKNQHNNHQLNVPLSRKDIFYSGSLYHLKEFTSQPSVHSFVQAMTVGSSDSSISSVPSADLGQQGPCGCSCRRLLGTASSLGRHLIDFSVFRVTIFIPILIGAVLIQMSQFIPTTFIGDHGLQHGLIRAQISTVLGIYGGLNVLGRLSAGVLVYLRCVQSLWLCNFAVAICGVCCLAFPLCTNFTSLCVFAASLGYFIGYFAPLQVLIIVDYVGLDKLTSSLGLLQMVKGPAALVGPPIAGLIYQWTKDYGMSVIFSAGLFILAAGVQSLVPLLNRKCCCRSRLKQDTVEDQSPVETSSDELSSKG